MCNLNVTAQILRIVFGLLLVAMAWYGPRTDILAPADMHLWFLGWFGLVPLISGIAAFCPIYAVLGFGHKNHTGKPS